MGISIGGFNGPGLAEVRSVSAHGVPGCGVYVLHLQLKILAANLKSKALISQLSCRIETTNPSLKISDGVLEGHPVIEWFEYTDESQLGFFFYLSANQISAIENFRNSGDLKLSIWLSGVVNYEGQVNDFYGKDDYVISKQQWLEALSSMKYKDTLLFELPMPKQDGSDKDKLKELLERAQSHLINGHYQESVGLCRQAIELIEELRKDKKEAANAAAKYKEKRKEMNINERMLFFA